MPHHGNKPMDLETRLFRHRRIEGDCWLWTGCIDSCGRGKIIFNRRRERVHRISAMLYLGYILTDDRNNQINHKQCCPNKHCFNPEHLYIGSQSDNARDVYKTGQPYGNKKILMTRR